ncbi:MAG: metallophosphoesterase [Gammaproteobacteria bacterium]
MKPLQATRSVLQKIPFPVRLALGGIATAVLLLTAIYVVLAPSPPFAISVPLQQPAVPWTSNQALQAEQDFYFAVVSDRTGEHRTGVFPQALEKINLIQPAFVVSVGDLIEGYTTDAQELQAQWDEIEGFVARLKMPFFYVAGNHDMSNRLMADFWQQRFGPTYYHFVYKDTLFVVLNSELFSMVHNGQPLPAPWQLEQQTEYLAEVLDDYPEVRWTFVFVHQPLWDSYRVHPEWSRVETMLQGRKHTVFAGHTHNYTLHRRNQSNYITLSTTGGGSALRGTDWGEFDHFALIRMTDGGPQLANLELDGIHPANIVTETGRSIRHALERSIQVVPDLHEDASFKGGTASFKIQNLIDQPVDLRASFSVAEGYEPIHAHGSMILPPGAQEQINVPLMITGAPLSLGHIAPLEATFKIATANPDHETPIALEFSRFWLPEYRFSIGRSLNRVHLDGQHSEWPQPRFIVTHPILSSPERSLPNYRGPADLSFAFDLTRDERYLYIMLRVLDDSIVQSDQQIARLQDSITLVLDTRPEPGLSRNYAGLTEMLATGDLHQVVVPIIATVDTPADPILSDLGLKPIIGLKTAVQMNEDGYAMEIAIPLQALTPQNTAANTPGGINLRKLRFNLTITDYDEGEKPTELSWRTPRTEPGAVVGSGIFQL